MEESSANRSQINQWFEFTNRLCRAIRIQTGRYCEVHANFVTNTPTEIYIEETYRGWVLGIVPVQSKKIIYSHDPVYPSLEGTVRDKSILKIARVEAAVFARENGITSIRMHR